MEQKDKIDKKSKLVFTKLVKNFEYWGKNDKYWDEAKLHYLIIKKTFLIIKSLYPGYYLFIFFDNITSHFIYAKNAL